MKAIVINKVDQSLSYTDVPNPVLKDGEVLIETYAAALNRADLLQREGNYPPPPGCPEWPGLEVAGIISGRALNNRLLINGNIGYRESEMHNSNFVGDVDVQYLFNQSFRIKGYNITNDRYFSKQTFMTQGFGFVFQREFNNLKELFRKKKKAEKENQQK